MKNKLNIISYTFAMIAALCFASGVVVLADPVHKEEESAWTE